MPTSGPGRPVRVAAVDLGASSGRVVAADVGADTLQVEEVHRFENGAVRRPDGSLRWDVETIRREVLAGLRAVAARGPVDSVGIDSWAVDYALVEPDGSLRAEPFSHRDDRVDATVAVVDERVGREEHYAVTGLQHLPFTTHYQLAAEPDLEGVSLLLLPDLVGFWLTGSHGAEVTNASTTGLLDVRRREWATEIADRLDLPAALLPPLRRPGDTVGVVLPEVADSTGLGPGTPVTAVGSHDTASAVVAVPAATDPIAYVSSGTWSLVGVELDQPVLTAGARHADFTNEAGVDGTIRFLRNVAGLWVLSETVRTWGTDDLPGLLHDAAHTAPFGPVVDLDDPAFLPPGDMPARIDDACRRTGQAPPASRPELVRCILESLALAYRRTLREAAELAGVEVDRVHVVGGGVRNQLLCQLTADACGLEVAAGPVEATAIGNVLVQARALGVDLPDLAAMRRLVASTQEVTTYRPSDDPDRRAAWDAAAARISPSPDRPARGS